MTSKIKKYAVIMMAALLMVLSIIGYSMTNVDDVIATTEGSEKSTMSVLKIRDTIGRVKVSKANVGVPMEAGNL